MFLLPSPLFFPKKEKEKNSMHTHVYEIILKLDINFLLDCSCLLASVSFLRKILNIYSIPLFPTIPYPKRMTNDPDILFTFRLALLQIIEGWTNYSLYSVRTCSLQTYPFFREYFQHFFFMFSAKTVNLSIATELRKVTDYKNFSFLFLLQ